jgi:hypothetical protein
VKKPKTMARSEVSRLAFCNSRKCPRFVNDNGVRKEWVGIGWIPCNERPKKTDVVLVEG